MEEKSLFEIIKHFGKTVIEKLVPKFDEDLVKKEPVNMTFNKDLKPKTMFKNQRKIFNKYKDSKRFSMSEPPGAGKSMAIMFAMAYRLLNATIWANHKIIIIIPQTVGSKSFGKDTIMFDDGTIFHWDICYNLCATSESQKVDQIIEFLKRRKFTNNPNERVLITTHAAMARAYAKIGYSDELFDNTSFVIDEAHHIMYAKAEESFVTNQIGELVQAINGNLNCSIWLATATPFRGDRNSIIPKEQMKTFDIHFLPLDKHWAENLKHIKSFAFDFVIYKAGGVFEAVKEIIKNKKKTIIFCPFQGNLVEDGDKRTFRDTLISSILSVWPECKIMDLIETDGREPIKKKLLDNVTAGIYDVILTLKMFDESTDWVCAQQCIDLTPSNTLRVMYQRFGRLWRDFFGKTLISYYCFLPFEADFDNEEKRREHLSNAYNVFVATLLLQETTDPIPYPVKKFNYEPIEFKVDYDFDEEIQINPLDKATDDENAREELIHAVIDKLLIMASHDPNPNSIEVYKWIEAVVDKHGITEDKDEVIKHITKILRRTLKFGKKPDWVGDSIDISWMREAGFDEIWSNDILPGLLMFGNKTCGLEHFEDFRRIFDTRKSIEEWFETALMLKRRHNDRFPSHYWLNKNHYSGLSAAILKYPEVFAELLEDRSGKTVEEHYLDAKELSSKNYGKIPSPKWLLENGYSGLIAAIRLHPEKFAEFEREFERNLKTLQEHRADAERLSSENCGKIPTNKWLEDNGYTQLIQALYDHPDVFSDLEKEKVYVSKTEHVRTAGKIFVEHKNIFPSLPWLEANGHSKLARAIRSSPKLFKHLRPTRKTPQEQLLEAKKLFGNLLPNNTELQKNHKGIYMAKYKNPEMFAHIPQEPNVRKSSARRLKDVA